MKRCPTLDAVNVNQWITIGDMKALVQQKFMAKFLTKESVCCWPVFFACGLCIEMGSNFCGKVINLPNNSTAQLSKPGPKEPHMASE